MNWRPWIIVGLLIGLFVVNGALLYYEDVDRPGEAEDFVDQIKDDLASVPFAPSTRLKNFKAFGLPDDMADAADAQAKRVYAKKDRFKELLREHSDDVGLKLCPSGGVPQRYAALSFLVDEKDGVREVLSYDRITYFEIREWYMDANVEEIYGMVELEPPKKDASTAMGVAAILLGREREADLLEGRSPWGSGRLSAWSFTKVHRQYPEVERKLVQYFALMHVLTELANAQDGICM